MTTKRKRKPRTPVEKLRNLVSHPTQETPTPEGPVMLRGTVLPNPTYSKSTARKDGERFIRIELEDGQILKVRDDHTGVDSRVAIVVLEHPERYEVKVEERK